MKLYLVRHGQTLFNVVHRIQGWSDSPLTKEGIYQANLLRKGLQDIAFDAVYSSTSERAVDTATLIMEGRSMEVTCLKGLKELNFGTLEAEYEADVLAPDGSSHEIGYIAYGGENRQLLQDRMMKTLVNIAQQHPHGNVLVVSHGASIMNVLMKIDSEKVKQYRQKGLHIENCSVTILSYEDGKFTVDVISDISYRKER